MIWLQCNVCAARFAKIIITDFHAEFPADAFVGKNTYIGLPYCASVDSGFIGSICGKMCDFIVEHKVDVVVHTLGVDIPNSKACYNMARWEPKYTTVASTTSAAKKQNVAFVRMVHPCAWHASPTLARMCAQKKRASVMQRAVRITTFVAKIYGIRTW